MSFGDRLRTARKAKGLTQSQLATQIGVAKSTLTGYEKGNREPDVDKIKALSGVLGITGGYLLGIDDGELKVQLSIAAQRIGRLYDRADDRAREIVEVTLKPFDNDNDSGRAAPPRSDTETAAELAPTIDFEPKITELPLYTQSVAAGLGNYLDSDDYDMVGFGDVPRHANIAVRITGDSMEPLYRDGDIVFVETESVLDEGEIGIFNYESQGYIKKLMFNPPRLVSLNKKYPDIHITEHSQCYTIGRVLGKE